MNGLSAQLYKALRNVMLDCGLCKSQQQVESYFTVLPLSIWRNKIPSSATSSVDGRVNALIDFLHKQNTKDGDNALHLFLQIAPRTI